MRAAQSVDPAALMVAVFAVAVGPLTEPGEWEALNTIVSAAILLVILPYALTKASRESLRHGPRLPLSVVIGLVVGIGCAWPVQRLAQLDVIPYSVIDFFGGTTGTGTYIGLSIGGLIALVAWAGLTIWSRTSSSPATTVAAQVETVPPQS